ncbi:hypothetical protein [Labrenzia sp. R5_0]|nr:hypothetical protein [Labrenzia sp. R5_0]
MLAEKGGPLPQAVGTPLQERGSQVNAGTEQEPNRLARRFLN